jgi:hypothetical protein
MMISLMKLLNKYCKEKNLNSVKMLYLKWEFKQISFRILRE